LTGSTSRPSRAPTSPSSPSPRATTSRPPSPPRRRGLRRLAGRPRPPHALAGRLDARVPERRRPPVAGGGHRRALPRSASARARGSSRLFLPPVRRGLALPRRSWRPGRRAAPRAGEAGRLAEVASKGSYDVLVANPTFARSVAAAAGASACSSRPGEPFGAVPGYRSGSRRSSGASPWTPTPVRDRPTRGRDPRARRAAPAARQGVLEVVDPVTLEPTPDGEKASSSSPPSRASSCPSCACAPVTSRWPAQGGPPRASARRVSGAPTRW
jgi:hypothetical protein